MPGKRKLPACLPSVNLRALDDELRLHQYTTLAIGPSIVTPSESVSSCCSAGPAASPAPPQQASRLDAPSLNPTKRGCKVLALMSASEAARSSTQRFIFENLADISS
jgi:hypothetical protein